MEPRSPVCEANVQPQRHLGYILNDNVQKDLMQTLFYWLKKNKEKPQNTVSSRLQMNIVKNRKMSCLRTEKYED